MNKIQRSQSNQRMSQIVIHNDIIYLSGQVGNKNSQSIKIQTSEVLDKIEKLLLDAGSNKKNILSATIYLKDMAFFEEMNMIWDNWLPKKCSPARATVESNLALPEFLVEICIIAAK